MRKTKPVEKKAKAKKAPEVVEAVPATPETKIAEISKELVRVEKESKSMVVKTQADYEKASIFLSSVVKPRVNRINTVMESFIAPWRKQRKDALEEMNRIEALFSGSLKPLVNIEYEVKGLMSGFLREQDAIARKEEERLAALRAKQDERREEKGKAPILTPLPTVERPQATVSNSIGGRTTAKKVWKAEIQSYTAIGEPYKSEILRVAFEKGIADQVIRKAVTAGVREISGVKIYEDFDISATAK